jgi:purine-binding chemotaxis protein CheW
MKENEELEDIQLVAFKLGDEEYGVDISQIREIIKSVEITKMPNTPDYVDGVINLRGSITTVMDLRKKLEIATKEDARNNRIVIVELEGNTIGMMVDSVTEVLNISTGDIDTESVNTSQIEAEYFRGVGKLKDRILILLDLNKVISGAEAAQIEKVKESEPVPS